MNEKKSPNQELTEKNNGLSSVQEVLFQVEYKKADKDRDNNKKG